MSWLYVPGTAGCPSESNWPCQLLEQSATWRGKLSPLKTWRRRWAAKKGSPVWRPWIQRLCGRISPPSTAARGVAKWISSLAVCRVSHSVPPGSDSILKMIGGCGTTPYESSTRPEPPPSSSRTSPDSASGVSLSSCATLTDAGSMSNGTCFLRPRSAHLISESASSCSLPTPTVGDSRASGNRNLPGSNAHKGTSLTDAIVRYPTPKARDHRSGKGYTSRPNSPDLEKVVGGQLNPPWVEWLMGLPIEWTGSGPSATEWSRWLWLMRFELLRLESDG